MEWIRCAKHIWTWVLLSDASKEAETARDMGLMLHLLSQVSQDGIPSFPNGIVWTTNIAQGAPQVSLHSAFL